MPRLAVLAVGQSNSRSTQQHGGGNLSVPNNLMVWNNGELKMGSKFVPAELGKWPFNIKALQDSVWANNLSLSFCREASATYDPRLVMVAKGGHKLECFIKDDVRKRNGWKFPASMSDMSGFIFRPRLGIMRALRTMKMKHFSVVLFHQGEANGGQESVEYEQRFLAFRRDLIRMGAITDKTPIIVGGLFTGGNYYTTHKATIQRISAMFPHVKFVDSNGLTSNDGIHFDGPSITILGQRYWQSFSQ